VAYFYAARAPRSRGALWPSFAPALIHARELTLIRPTLPVLIVSGSQISSDMAFEMESRNGNFYPSLVDFH
jgi:hypothetical protein